MRSARLLTILSIILFAMALPAEAQRTRRAKPRPTPRPTPKIVKTSVSPVVAAARQKVANQLYNVNRFVDALGPVAVDIEKIDNDAKTRRLKKEVVDGNDENKQNVILAIKGLRQGLMALESEFRTKPQLSQYLKQIQGIGLLCAQSEDRAIAGRFVESKDPLRQVALKLTDTMGVMP